jgi:putative zinc ribbon protein
MPDLTVEDMIKRSFEVMTRDHRMHVQRAEEISRAVIPKLKRWKE